LDLGSTSTKLKVYSVTQVPNQLPEISLQDNKKFKPGVSNFANELDEVDNYFKPIIDFAKTKVLPEHRDQTAIFAMATAGLRFLDAQVARNLMNKVRQTLSTSSFKYEQQDVQILSGEEEGVYGWLALNYLLGYFDTPRQTNQTTGLLEMGGGSTQITFIPQEPLYAGEFQVELRGELYEVYVHSYLDYGLTAIETKVATYLKDRDLTDNPCLLKGDSKSYTLEDGSEVRNNGVGDGVNCTELFTDLLKTASDTNCHPKPCAIGNQYQPHVGSVPFYATQAFVYAPEALGTIETNDRLNLTKLIDSGEEYCKQSLSNIPEKGRKYASSTCLASQYFPVLLSGAYRIPPSTVVKVTSEINGQNIDWALGAVIAEMAKSLNMGCSVKKR